MLRTIWSVSTLDACPGRPWLDAFCHAAASRFHACQPQHLSIYAYSLTRLGHVPGEHWVEALLEASGESLRRASAQNVANLVWALGKWRWVAVLGF